MIRLFCGIALVAAMGCTGIHAVGPLTKPGGSTGGADAKADRDPVPPDPVVIPAPTPTPPKCLVHAEDVTADNVEIIKQQLSTEFDFDRNNMPSVPVTTEVSRYKDGVNSKQQ